NRFIIYEQTFAEAPRDILSAELMEQVDRPHLASSGRFQSGNAAVRVLVVDVAGAVGHRCAGSREFALPCRAILRLPYQLPAGIEGEDVQFIIHVSGKKDPTVSDDR